MPYKDPERKKEWERLHRPQRLARRRELRRIEVTQQAAQPEVPSTQHGGYGFLIPMGRAQMERPMDISRSHQLAFD
jgi:hypothetical protein